MEGKPRRPVSSRSVVWMTPEQVQRKRALDRINQRSSRANARKRIEELENEVAQLQSTLQISEQERLRLEENEQNLRQIIQTAFSSMQELPSGTTVTGIETTVTPGPSAALENPQTPPPVATEPSTDPPGADVADIEPEEIETPSVEPSTVDEANFASDLSTETSPFTATTSAEASEDPHILIADSSSGFVFGRPLFPKDDIAFRLWDNSPPTGEAADFWNGISLSLPPNDPAFDALMGEEGATSAVEVDAAVAESSQSDVNQGVDSLPRWTVLPQHTAPTCRIDQVISTVTQSRRNSLAEAQNRIEFTSTTFPSVASLLNPSTERASTFPVSSTLAKHAPWMAVPSLPEKLAVMYGMCNYVRWLIEPTEQYYLAIPEFYRPTRIQLTTRHPAWVDLIAWPQARELIIEKKDYEGFEHLRSLLAETLSVNWPHSPATVITMVSQGEIALTPAFISHLLDLRNWSVGPEIIEAFPYLDFIPVRPTARR